MTDSNRTVLIAKYRVVSGETAAVAEALAEMAIEVRANEPACLEYKASVDVEDENLYCLFEVYTDDTALAAHRETPHFKRIIEGKIVPRLESREREVYRLVVG